jgi:hypothetical protein
VPCAHAWPRVAAESDWPLLREMIEKDVQKPQMRRDIGRFEQNQPSFELSRLP